MGGEEKRSPRQHKQTYHKHMRAISRFIFLPLLAFSFSFLCLIPPSLVTLKNKAMLSKLFQHTNSPHTA